MLTFAAILLGFVLLCGVIVGIYWDFRRKMLESLHQIELIATEAKADFAEKSGAAVIALDKMAETATLAGAPLDVVRDMGNLGKRIASLPLDAVEKGINLSRR